MSGETKSPEWRPIDDAHKEFAGGILDVVRFIVGRLATGAPMDAEALRDAFASLAPEGAPTIVSLPARQLVEDLEKIIEVRDNTRFNRALEIGRATGRIAPGGTA